VAVFVGKQTHGSDQSVQEATVHQRKRILHLVSGILNDDPIIAGVAASTVLGALEALFGLPQLSFQGLLSMW